MTTELVLPECARNNHDDCPIQVTWNEYGLVLQKCVCGCHNQPWVIEFRQKGENPNVGGFFRADSTEERDTVAAQLKEAGLRVVWSQTKQKDNHGN